MKAFSYKILLICALLLAIATCLPTRPALTAPSNGSQKHGFPISDAAHTGPPLYRNVKLAASPYRKEMTSILSDDDWYHWNEHGYLILRNFVPVEKITSLNEYVEDLWERRKQAPEAETVTMDVHIYNVGGTERL